LAPWTAAKIARRGDCLARGGRYDLPSGADGSRAGLVVWMSFVHCASSFPAAVDTTD